MRSVGSLAAAEMFEGANVVMGILNVRGTKRELDWPLRDLSDCGAWPLQTASAYKQGSPLLYLPISDQQHTCRKP
jgi:hypothetical protein